MNLSIAAFLFFALSRTASGQTVAPPQLAAFEEATIKPAVTNHTSGFRSRPGGRVEFEGASVKQIMTYAFDVQRFQIVGGAAWVGGDTYDIVAVPPESSSSRTAIQPPVLFRPGSEQREMLQSLLANRFGLKYHWETKEGPVFILSRGKNKLALEEPKDKDHAAVCAVFVRGEIADGEVRCSNAPVERLVSVLSENLEIPVVDRTGISGSYDLHVLPFDPTNKEITTAMYGAMERLGLKLERSKGPVKTIVIDSVSRPSAN